MDESCTRDDAGRITAIAGLTPQESWSYGYNHLDWLVTVDNSFAYDAIGNLPQPQLATGRKSPDKLCIATSDLPNHMGRPCLVR